MGVRKLIITIFIVCFFCFESGFADGITFSGEDEKPGGGCTIYPGHDIEPGYDLKILYAETLSDCCRLCSKTPECKGWTYYQSKCHFKREQILVPAFNGVEVTSGFVDGSEPNDVEVVNADQFLVKSPKHALGESATCSISHGLISDEANIEVIQRHVFLGECCHECSITEGCVAWTQYLGICTLKSSTKIEEGADSAESTGISGILL